jgi:hypothetical protein
VTALAPGLRVKCVKIGGWTNDLDGTSRPGPSVGSVWTVAQVCEWLGTPYLVLKEWRDGFGCFHASRFVPLDGHEDMTDLEAALKCGPPVHDSFVRERAKEICDDFLREFEGHP